MSYASEDGPRFRSMVDHDFSLVWWILSIYGCLTTTVSPGDTRYRHRSDHDSLRCVGVLGRCKTDRRGGKTVRQVWQNV